MPRKKYWKKAAVKILCHPNKGSTACNKIAFNDNKNKYRVENGSDTTYDPTPSQCLQLSDASFVHGNIHQGDVMFTELTRGRQCTCNALVALCKLRHITELSMPSSSDIDDILIKGDELYHNVIMNLAFNHTLANYYLTFDELPTKFDINRMVYNITKHPFLCGDCYAKTNSELLGYSMHNGLLESFQSSSTVLLMMGGTCIAVLKGSNGSYYLCDSHARNDKGLPSSYGTSIFMAFDSFRSLMKTIEGLAHKICTQETNFEILPITIETKQGKIQYKKPSSDEANTGYSMIRYMKDQMTRTNDMLKSSVINTQAVTSCEVINEKLHANREYLKLAKQKSTCRGSLLYKKKENDKIK